MIINPIIPIWLMAIVSILLLIYIIKYIPKKIRINFMIIVLLLFIINLRVMYRNDKALTNINDLDVLFVIDSTISMNAEDYNNSTRLKEVKKDCQHIVDELDGARFSIIDFNNSSKIMIPYTRDNDLVKNTIDIIKPLYEFYGRGSSLNTPKDDIKESLSRSKNSDDRIIVVFFISDGEITDESKLDSYKSLQDDIDNGAVLGYGTKKGGYMRTDDYYGKATYVIDRSNYSYDKAVSKLDEDNLKKIANDLKIDYIHMSRQNNIDNKLKELKKMTKNEVSESDIKSYEDTYYIFIIPLLILLVFNYKRYKEVYSL